MAHRTQGRVVRQLQETQRCLHSVKGLPFVQLLDPSMVQEALAGVAYRCRLYTPVLTLYVFLSQVMDPIQCCVQAVARLMAHLVAQGSSACAPGTGAYCDARQRLPETVVQQLMRQTGRHVHDRTQPTSWRWQGRAVKVVDGTGASMPDTPANQKAYPQSRKQRPGCGFPLLRMVVVFSLAVGTVLDAAIAAHQGKLTGEISLLRALRGLFEPGDVLLGDRAYCTYADLAWCREHCVDAVVRLATTRRTDFRCGRRLGRKDHIVTWSKPNQCPASIDHASWARLPDVMTLREAHVTVDVPGFRTEEYVVVTTLLDPAVVTVRDLADLYRARWQSELHLRSLKHVLHLDDLRCKTPEMVRKEIWVRLLAYNLLRSVMADAAEKYGVLPCAISFKSTLEYLLAFAPVLAGLGGLSWSDAYGYVLQAIARFHVGDRPDRSEPRVRKRRAKAYPYMVVPRHEARNALMKQR